MRFTISRSLFLLTCTMGLVTGLNSVAEAYVPTPAAISSGAELAQFPSFPGRPNFDRDNLDDIRDRVEDRRDDRDEDDRDDFRDRIGDRRNDWDEDDRDDFRDRIGDRDEDDFDDFRDRIRDRR